MTSRNGDASYCGKYLDIMIDCGVYKKGTTKEVLKYLLAQNTISSQQFKFIISVQKSGMCRGLVQRALIKFKPLFDISSTCSIAAEAVHEFTCKPYIYDEVLDACANYVQNDSYLNFTKNYNAIFNENKVIKNDEQQKFIDDLLALVDAFETKKGERPYFRRFAVCESLMFFIRYKVFNDFLRFQIFAIFKKGKLDENISREMFDSEVKWMYWRAYGFPSNYSSEEFSMRSTSSSGEIEKSKQAEIQRNSAFDAFLESENISEIASGDSAEWHLNRVRLFK